MKIGQTVNYTSVDGQVRPATIVAFHDENGPSGYKILHLVFEDKTSVDAVVHEGDAAREVVEPRREERDEETGAVTKFEAVTAPTPPFWSLKK